MIPYGKQTIERQDIDAVIKVFEENDMLTNGKYVSEFENVVCNYVDSKYGLAVNSGTAALHLATYAAGITKDDEVIVPAISFVASANCILYQSGKPVFCDIDAETLCIDTSKIEKLITSRTKAILFVDMCGQPCNFEEIDKIAKKYKLITIHDAAHSLGALYKGVQKVGSYADITCFSFHPVKNITTCEGGMMVTNNEIYYNLAKAFRTHGISRDFKERENMQSHYYEMTSLGFNYRIPDVLCALGIEQLKRLDTFIAKRNYIADKYNELFNKHNESSLIESLDKTVVEPLNIKYDNFSAYHLYIIKLKTGINRDKVFKQLKEAGIGVNVHYMPIYLHPYYQNLGYDYGYCYDKGICPVAEEVYEQMITLPIFPLMKDDEIKYVYDMVNLYSRDNL